MRRLFFCVVVATGLLTAGASQADFVSIDLFNTPVAPVPDSPFGAIQTYLINGPCYCQPGHATGFFEVHSGDVVDFGTLTIHETFLGGHNGSGNPLNDYALFPLLYNTDIAHPITYFNTLPNFFTNGPTGAEATYDLTFGFGADAYIQFAWMGPYDYTPPSISSPVPEPSTWAMMILGFAGVGFLGYRRLSINTRSRRTRS